MKPVIVNIIVSITCSLGTIAAYSLIKAETSATQLAVLNYDVVNLQGAGRSNSELEESYTNLRVSANKLTAAGYVVVDSRSLVSYPPELEIPIIEHGDETDGAEGAVSE